MSTKPDKTKLAESQKNIDAEVAKLEAGGANVSPLRAALKKHDDLVAESADSDADDPDAVAGSDKVRRTN